MGVVYDSWTRDICLIDYLNDFSTSHGGVVYGSWTRDIGLIDYLNDFSTSHVGVVYHPWTRDIGHHAGYGPVRLCIRP